MNGVSTSMYQDVVCRQRQESIFSLRRKYSKHICSKNRERLQIPSTNLYEVETSNYASNCSCLLTLQSPAATTQLPTGSDPPIPLSSMHFMFETLMTEYPSPLCIHCSAVDWAPHGEATRLQKIRLPVWQIHSWTRC